MLVKQGYRVELDLNDAQKTLALKHCGAARWAYNYGLRRKQEEYKAGRKTPSAIDLHREINALKQTDIPWAYEVSKCAMQEALRDLDSAFGHFFRKCRLKKQGLWKGKCGYPKFKSKKKAIGGARFTGAIKVYPDAIQLPRLGLLKLKERGYLPMNVKIGSATMSEKAGRWYISVCFHREQPEPTPATGSQKQRFYEYDYGTTTELKLKVIGARDTETKGQAIRILARDTPPLRVCDACGQAASDVYSQCILAY